MNAQVPSEEHVHHECYHNKFHGEQCGARATWRGKGAGNSTDGWTWCDEHVTSAENYRERIES